VNKYIGHENQIYGVEEMRLSAGKGDGMRMLCVRNGKGLEIWVSLDRCADMARFSFKGDNFGYFAPCGFVSPKYYDDKGAGFLKSFTAGFCTTCGLTAVGSPCTDNGEDLPLHGTISNTPCENSGHWIDDNGIHIKAVIRDAALFSHKLLLEREYIITLEKNEVTMTDTVKNIGSQETPLEVLYHCNMGYPLLSENAILTIPSTEIEGRNDHAAKHIDTCLDVEKPQNGYEEMCFYHTMNGLAEVSLYNPDINKGIKMSYDTENLKCFTQWKMMGEHEYVMGLEPGNCYPDGRDVMREKGILEFLKPGEEKTFSIKFEAFEK